QGAASLVQLVGAPLVLLAATPSLVGEAQLVASGPIAQRARLFEENAGLGGILRLGNGSRDKRKREISAARRLTQSTSLLVKVASAALIGGNPLALLIARGEVEAGGCVVQLTSLVQERIRSGGIGDHSMAKRVAHSEPAAAARILELTSLFVERIGPLQVARHAAPGLVAVSKIHATRPIPEFAGLLAQGARSPAVRARVPAALVLDGEISAPHCLS